MHTSWKTRPYNYIHKKKTMPFCIVNISEGLTRISKHCFPQRLKNVCKICQAPWCIRRGAHKHLCSEHLSQEDLFTIWEGTRHAGPIKKQRHAEYFERVRGRLTCVRKYLCFLWVSPLCDPPPGGGLCIVMAIEIKPLRQHSVHCNVQSRTT